MSSFDITAIAKVFYKIGEKAALNLWPRSVLPGVEPSQWMKVGLGLLALAALWSLVQGSFLKADDTFVGGPEELQAADELQGSEELQGAESSDVLSAVDDLVVSPLSSFLGDVTDTLQGVLLGAKKKSAKAANKKIASTAGTAAKKAYQKPFVHRLVTNLVVLYIILVILLQIGSLTKTDSYFVTSADFAKGTGTSYAAYSRRYAPYRSDYSSYRKSY